MSYSIQRELEEIEYRRTQAQQVTQQRGSRRGSSIFAVPNENDESGPYGRPAYLTSQPGESLLVDFPEAAQQQNANVNETQSQQSSGYSVQSQQHPTSSSTLTPGDYNMPSSSLSDSVRSDGFVHSAKMMKIRNDTANRYDIKPRRSEAARMQELANSQDLPGGPNHRPLVGGFAAAAYEAAKAHHYSTKKSGAGSTRVDRPPPPCI